MGVRRFVEAFSSGLLEYLPKGTKEAFEKSKTFSVRDLRKH